MDHAHEIDVHYSPKQRRIGFCKRCGLCDACVGDQDVDGLAACGLRDRGTHRGLIPNIGYTCEMPVPPGDCFVQSCPITAEHPDGCPPTFKAPCEPAPSSPAT